MSEPVHEVETLPEDVAESRAEAPSRAVTVGLVVLVARGDGRHTNAWIPLAPLGSTYLIGRGDAQATDPYPRAQAFAVRDGRRALLPPLTNPHLSRAQWSVRASRQGVEIESVGRAPLVVRGLETRTAVLAPGEVAQMGAQMLFMCARRLEPDRRPDAQMREQAERRTGIIGESVVAATLRERIRLVAEAGGHVLVHGPTGSGKELVSRGVHLLSDRAKGPFVARNAATIPESIADAELFGHARGYPNAGMPERRGLVGEADGGSLFLDEFAELPRALQAHLLRVLDAGEYQRLGESTTRVARLRFIGATNRLLSDLREDLLARFSHRIDVPPLDARPEDIPLLARHMLRGMAEEGGSARRLLDDEGEPRLSVEAMRALVERRYPANVRELRNALADAVARSSSSELDIVPSKRPTDPTSGAVTPTESPADADGPYSAKELQAALDRNNGVVEATWRSLGLASRFVLQRLIRKHKLQIRKSVR